jgi:hypothetical protein
MGNLLEMMACAQRRTIWVARILRDFPGSGQGQIKRRIQIARLVCICSTMAAAMGNAEVAAGDGAFNTCTLRGVA